MKTGSNSVFEPLTTGTSVSQGCHDFVSEEGRARWNQRSVTSADVAREYGSTDVDGSRPDIWAKYH